MKTMIGKFLLFFVCSSFSLAVVPQSTDWSDFPVTSNSPKALELFVSGLKAVDNVNMREATDYFKKASELEPNFVLPNIYLASLNFYIKNMDRFKEYVNKSLASTYKLNDSEVLLQEAFKKLLDDPRSNVVEFGEKLVKLNPKSVVAHQILSTFQLFAGDYEGQIKTLTTMLKLVKDPAPIYNSLGYGYLELNKIDEAIDSFERYIKAAPDNPNAYDSMGDYYVKIEDYKKAHAYFTKAYRMDTLNFKISLEKANKLQSQLGY